MAWFNWRKRSQKDKEKQVERKQIEENFLFPGTCQCSHIRSLHQDGLGACHAAFPPDEETDYWTECACQIYIPDKGGDVGNNDDSSSPPDPVVIELNRMASL